MIWKRGCHAALDEIEATPGCHKGDLSFMLHLVHFRCISYETTQVAVAQSPRPSCNRKHKAMPQYVGTLWDICVRIRWRMCRPGSRGTHPSKERRSRAHIWRRRPSPRPRGCRSHRAPAHRDLLRRQGMKRGVGVLPGGRARKSSRQGKRWRESEDVSRRIRGEIECTRSKREWACRHCILLHGIARHCTSLHNIA